MKKSVFLGIIVTIFVTLNILLYSLTSIDFYYEDSELTLSSTNDKIKEEIYEYIKIFDKNIIESLQVYDNNQEGLSNEQMIDISVKYIISNKDKFSDDIVHFSDEYIYEKDGSMYFSNGYVDKGTLKKVASEFFYNDDLDIENSIYFDKNRNLVPLLSIYGDISPYIKYELVNFEEMDYKNYSITIRYFINNNYSFNIKYNVIRDEYSEFGKYSVLGIEFD